MLNKYLPNTQYIEAVNTDKGDRKFIRTDGDLRA